jgi:hypothetical protein
MRAFDLLMSPAYALVGIMGGAYSWLNPTLFFLIVGLSGSLVIATVVIESVAELVERKWVKR